MRTFNAFIGKMRLCQNVKSDNLFVCKFLEVDPRDFADKEALGRR